jgi:hypothetical protein
VIAKESHCAGDHIAAEIDAARCEFCSGHVANDEYIGLGFGRSVPSVFYHKMLEPFKKNPFCLKKIKKEEDTYGT